MNNPLRWFLELVQKVIRDLGKQPRDLHSWQARGEDFATGRPWIPQAEVRGGEDGRVALRIDLPGVEPAGVDVGARAASVITISGVGERGTFYRQLVLPYEVHGDEATAEMRDGVLWVTADAKESSVEGYPYRVPVERAHSQEG